MFGPKETYCFISERKGNSLDPLIFKMFCKKYYSRVPVTRLGCKVASPSEIIKYIKFYKNLYHFPFNSFNRFKGVYHVFWPSMDGDATLGITFTVPSPNNWISYVERGLYAQIWVSSSFSESFVTSSIALASLPHHYAGQWKVTG